MFDGEGEVGEDKPFESGRRVVPVQGLSPLSSMTPLSSKTPLSSLSSRCIFFFYDWQPFTQEIRCGYKPCRGNRSQGHVWAIQATSKRRRIGHLFQGRYKAILIDADAYLLELVRYIHLNPVRAKMVKLPDEHPWSGHLALLGKEVLPWHCTDYVLSMFDSDAIRATKKYGDFVYEGLSEETRPEFGMGTHEGRLLGDDSFADEALMQADERPVSRVTLDEVISEVCRRFGITEAELAATGKARPASEARAVAAFLTRELVHLSLTELAKKMGREVSAVSQAARRLEKLALENEQVAEIAHQLLTKLQMSNLTR